VGLQTEEFTSYLRDERNTTAKRCGVGWTPWLRTNTSRSGGIAGLDDV
jgi:hypothetical protein